MQVAEAVACAQKGVALADHDTMVLAYDLNQRVGRQYQKLRLEVIPEIARIMERVWGEFQFVSLNRVERVLEEFGYDEFSLEDVVVIAKLGDYLHTEDYEAVGALFKKFGADICFDAASIYVEFEDLEAYSRHFVPRSETLARIEKTPLTPEEVVSLLESGIGIETILDLVRELRQDGYTNLCQRVRAAAEGHHKSLTGGVL